MNAKRWLAVSLLLNVAAAIWIAASRNGHPMTAPATAVPTQNRATSPVEMPKRVAAPAPSAKAPAAAVPGNTNLGKWIEALRGSGVPESLIAEMVATDFDQRWWKRQRELQRQFELGEIDEATLVDFSDRHESEREKEILAQLGPGSFREWSLGRFMQEFDRAGIAAAPGEAERAFSLRQELTRKVRELEQARREGLLDESEFVEYSSLSQARYERELASVLGQDRANALNGETGGGGGHLERELRSIGATAEQSTAVRDAQKKWESQRRELDEALGRGAITTADYEQRLRETDAQRRDACQQALGEDGYGQLQKAQDARYATLRRFAGAWELSAADIESVYGVLRTYDAGADQIRQQFGMNANTDDPRVRDAVRRNTAAAQQKLREQLGDDRFKRLMKADALGLQP